MDDALNKLPQIGLSLEVLSKSWSISTEEIERALTTLPSSEEETAVLTRQIIKPVSALTFDAVNYSQNPVPLAASLIDSLTTGNLRRGYPQITLAGISEMCNVSEDALSRFAAEGSELTTDELYRICVSLLIVDRELNFKPRGNYFAYRSEEESIEVDGRQIMAPVTRFVPEDVLE